MVDEHDAIGAESRSATGQADEPCCPFSSDTSTSQSHTLFLQRNPLRDQTQRPSSLEPSVGSACLPPTSFTFERASGSARSVDAIAVALSRQHLHNDTHKTVAEVPAAVLASSLATAFPTEDFTVHASSEQHLSTISSETQPHVAALGPPESQPVAPAQRDMDNSPLGSPSAGAHTRTRPGWKIPPRHPKSNIKSEATQELLESMICSETQCNVQPSPLSAPMSGGPRDFCSIESESSLDVDEIMTDGIGLERSPLDEFLNARCMLQPHGINKGPFPGYRSSKETALRCRNLVRSKPRMRKRTKLREQAGSSVVSSAVSPNVASTATIP